MNHADQLRITVGDARTDSAGTGVRTEGAKNERYSLSEDESKPGSFTPA